MLFTFVLAFTYSSYLIQGYWDYGVMDVFLMFYRVVLGDFNMYDTIYDAFYYSVVLKIYLISATLLLTVILLNLMIAIVNATYTVVVNSEEKTSNYELMNIVYDMESILTVNLLMKNKKSRFQGKYLVHIYEESKIHKIINIFEEGKMLELTKNVDKALKILKGMANGQSFKNVRERKKELIEKKYYNNIVIRETKDVYQVLLGIIKSLNRTRANSLGEKVHLINSLILYMESIKEAMTELF